MAQNTEVEKKDKKPTGPRKKVSEYGQQLQEKQRVKRMYGMRERQFRRFFALSVHAEGSPGDNLLSMLECRLDNALFRLKLATTRTQARQMIVHGHVMVNGRKVSSPSFQVSAGHVITLSQKMLERKEFVEQVVDKRLKLGIKVPEWLELDKKTYSGKVLRLPVREDLTIPVEDHLIVELYSK